MRGERERAEGSASSARLPRTLKATCSRRAMPVDQDPTRSGDVRVARSASGTPPRCSRGRRTRTETRKLSEPPVRVPLTSDPPTHSSPQREGALAPPKNGPSARFLPHWIAMCYALVVPGRGPSPSGRLWAECKPQTPLTAPANARPSSSELRRLMRNDGFRIPAVRPRTGIASRRC